jgi:hypothetical protein
VSPPLLLHCSTATPTFCSGSGGTSAAVNQEQGHTHWGVRFRTTCCSLCLAPDKRGTAPPRLVAQLLCAGTALLAQGIVQRVAMCEADVLCEATHLVVAICHDCAAHSKDGHACGACAGQPALDADGGKASHRGHVLHYRHVLHGLWCSSSSSSKEEEEGGGRKRRVSAGAGSLLRCCAAPGGLPRLPDALPGCCISCWKCRAVMQGPDRGLGGCQGCNSSSRSCTAAGAQTRRVDPPSCRGSHV